MTTASLIDYEANGGHPVDGIEIITDRVDEVHEVVSASSTTVSVSSAPTSSVDMQASTHRDPALAVFYIGILSLLVIIITSAILAL